MKNKKKRLEFSKLLIIYETLIIAFATVVTLGLAALSVIKSYTGALPYLTTLLTAAWAAYGTSAGFYYNKAKAENEIKLVQPPQIDKDL